MAGGGVNRGVHAHIVKINPLESCWLLFHIEIRERKQFSAFVLGIVYTTLLWSSSLGKNTHTHKRERCKCHFKSVWGRAFCFDSERYFKSVLRLSGSTRSGQKNALHLMLHTVSFNRIEQFSQQ